MREKFSCRSEITQSPMIRNLSLYMPDSRESGVTLTGDPQRRARMSTYAQARKVLGELNETAATSRSFERDATYQ